MKKVLLMILGAIVCMNSYAADNVVLQHRNVRKTPVKSANIVNENCMSFMGVSFNMSLTNFAKALKAKKFNVVDESTYYTKYAISGPAFGVANCNVYVSSWDDCICSVSIEHTSNSEATMLDARKKIQSYINKVFPNYTGYNYSLIDENGHFIDFHLRAIFNNNIRIGNLYFTTEHKGKNQYTIVVRLIDRRNHQKSENNNSDKIKEGGYDLTNFTSTLFDDCTLEVFDNFLIFDIKKDNKKYKIFAINWDYDGLKYMIFSKKRSVNEKIELLKRYFSSFNFVESDVYQCTSKYYDRLERCYNEEQILKQREDRLLREALKVKSPGEYIFRAFEGMDNIIRYKKDGSYDRRYQMFRRAWNRGVGGSSSGGTNWDGLNDAQKSVIHQNDNAR